MKSMARTAGLRVVHTADADARNHEAAVREVLGSWVVALDGPGEAYDASGLVALARAQWPQLPQLAAALERCTCAWPLPWADAGFLLMPPERMPERCEGYVALRRGDDTYWVEFMQDPDDAARIVLVRVQVEAKGPRRAGLHGCMKPGV